MFAAILSVDGSPVDVGPGRLPAGGGIRVAVVGAGQRLALLSSYDAPVDDEWRGIASLADRVWIAGRLRLDRRAALRDRLRADRQASDADLCLLAYAAWGERFVEEIAGDFSFVLWDETRGVLVAARDQFGVRALFHATAGGRQLVSDSLSWLASRPEIDRALDDHWIGDFLAMGRSLDFQRTVFAGIARLPPGHVLTLADAGARTRAYWTLDVPEPLHYRDGRQYAEHFRALVAEAVTDRLPASGRVGVSMSGGLDSPTLAALAVASVGDRGRIVAECVHYERLMPDDEPRFSTLVATHLGIPLRLRAVDELTYDRDWRCRGLRTAEPTRSIVFAHWTRLIMGEMAAAAPVWLYGEGPDNAFRFERDAYLSWLLRRGEWRRLVGAVLPYLRLKGHEIWTGKTRPDDRAQAVAVDAGILPPWLDRDFAARMHLDERVREANEIVDRSHGWHPRAVGSFTNPIWQDFFAERDLDESFAGLVWRHPFFDLRVLEFMLAVPPVPWARNKLLMRQSMQGWLPGQILDRPKTPLAASPIEAPIRRVGLGVLEVPDLLGKYVSTENIPARPDTESDLSALIAVHALDHWMVYTSEAGREEGSGA
ncbi:MAG: hypothetical protein JSR91_10820 [Proteobacteria bacterium]|nr:hypothetical protein [Pseudomonadota bacterium]